MIIALYILSVSALTILIEYHVQAQDDIEEEVEEAVPVKLFYLKCSIFASYCLFLAPSFSFIFGIFLPVLIIANIRIALVLTDFGLKETMKELAEFLFAFILAAITFFYI